MVLCSSYALIAFGRLPMRLLVVNVLTRSVSILSFSLLYSPFFFVWASC